MSQLKLKHRERRRLRQQLKAASDPRTYRRILAVLELDRGRSAIDIAAMLGVTRQSVHNWAAAFPRTEPVGTGRRRPERSPTSPVPAGRRPPVRPDGTVATGSRLSAHGLDHTSSPAGAGEELGAAAVGRDGEAWTPAARLRLEAATLRPRARPGAREKNGGFGCKSGPSLAAASCWPKTRPI
jgi:hypothetical protein